MTSDRHYRKAMEAEEALEEIERNANTQFCPTVVGALLGVAVRADLTG
jgi:HD-GYP domain-containing protein (c-di-GMP phosphodiesterase class II)